MSNPKCCGTESFINHANGKEFFVCGECKKEVIETKPETVKTWPVRDEWPELGLSDQEVLQIDKEIQEMFDDLYGDSGVSLRIDEYHVSVDFPENGRDCPFSYIYNKETFVKVLKNAMFYPRGSLTADKHLNAAFHLACKE